MAIKLLNFSELRPALAPTLIVNDLGLQKLATFLDNNKVFGLDSETNVTKTYVDRRLRTLQFGTKTEQFVVDLLGFAGSEESLVQQRGRTAPRWAKSLVEVISPALQSKEYLKVGVGLQFDYEMLLWCLGIRSTQFYDCNLAEKVIYAGKVGFWDKTFWGMEPMVARYCGLEMSKTEQKGFDLCTPLTEAQVLYAALDARLPLAIKNGQEAQITKSGLTDTVRIENGALSTFGDMHINGILLDTDCWRAIETKTKEIHKANVQALDNFFCCVVGSVTDEPFTDDLAFLEDQWRSEEDKEVRARYRVQYNSARKARTEREKKILTCEGSAYINYGSTPQLISALRLMGLKEDILPDTNDRTLNKLKGKYPVIKALQDMRDSQKKLSTYGESFIQSYVNLDTGRIHSNINQLGAETGRTTSSSPNIQNIPKGSAYRGSFICRPGYRFITVDMAGAELRILAEESGEKAWIDAFNKGWDVHSVGAEIIFGDQWLNGQACEIEDKKTKQLVPYKCAYYNNDAHQKCDCPKHKKLRDQIKAINFGIAYGMEAQKLADGLGITKNDAQALLDLYRSKFKQVTAYLKQSGENARLKLEARTLCGRRRIFEQPTWERAKEVALKRLAEDGKPAHFLTTGLISRAHKGIYSAIEREGKNSPIQGHNVDIAKIAMDLMWFDLHYKYGAEMVNFVHDEFDVECPEHCAEECMAFMGECINKAGACYMKKVVMDWDGQISDRWEK